MMHDYDICVIGSGAGGGPVALALAEAGYSVVVLEKGPWRREHDFVKDELTCCLREAHLPRPDDEPVMLQRKLDDGRTRIQTSHEAGLNFWTGVDVGGSTNYMSGYFHRLKPVDFHLRSTFGPIEGANVVDWPITYADLEPYYRKVETEIGISGRVVAHPHAEPRSTPDFPHPPLAEHPIATHIDRTCAELGLHPFPTPRAILPAPSGQRQGCSYSGYCGSYGCATGAKGSSRAALLDRAVATGRCTVIPNAMVSRLQSDTRGKVIAVDYHDHQGRLRRLDARLYVVACKAIESARLLLNSPGPKHPHGLANNQRQVGRNLLFAAGGAGSGLLPWTVFAESEQAAARHHGLFINRSLQDWYIIDDPEFGPRQKGGTVEFVHIHPNPVPRASRQIRGPDGRLLWGKPLKRRIERHFRAGRHVKIEAFCDWLPIDDCRVTLDPHRRDKWGLPVARVHLDLHVRNLQVGWYLATRGAEVLKRLGARDVVAFASGKPPTNLVAGTCRFGSDPKTSVLDADCRAHDVENLYVTDGSFMPNAGSAPFTWTIYANAFRVADRIIDRLGGPRGSAG